jgi:hypothetical protein
MHSGVKSGWGFTPPTAAIQIRRRCRQKSLILQVDEMAKSGFTRTKFRTQVSATPIGL